MESRDDDWAECAVGLVEGMLDAAVVFLVFEMVVYAYSCDQDLFDRSGHVTACCPRRSPLLSREFLK